MLLWIGMWNRLHAADGRITVVLDTRGTRTPDRLVKIFPHGQCLVYDIGNDALLGERVAHRRGKRGISCRAPVRWFDIGKTVRFRVKGEGGRVDRAPNDHHFPGALAAPLQP